MPGTAQTAPTWPLQAEAEAARGASAHAGGHLSGSGVGGVPPELLHSLGLSALARSPLERVSEPAGLLGGAFRGWQVCRWAAG